MDASTQYDPSSYTAILLEPLQHTIGISWARLSRGMPLWISQWLCMSVSPCLDSASSCSWFVDYFMLLPLFWDRIHIEPVLNTARMAWVLYQPWDQREYVHQCVQADIGAAQEVCHHNMNRAFSWGVPPPLSHPQIQNRLFLEFGLVIEKCLILHQETLTLL